MDDLIYSFLLQLDYPRASIVFDVDLLGTSPQIGSGMKVPTFVIVDPDSADPLAVIEVAHADSSKSLADTGTEAGAYACRLAGSLIQGFVIRVDAQSTTADEKVTFYRIWPNSTLKQLSARNFPDFGSLLVSRKLAVKANDKALEEARRDTEQVAAEAARVQESKSGNRKEAGAGLYLPALVLVFIIIADAAIAHLNGDSLLTLPYSVLAIGAAALLTLPAAIRYLRHQP